MSVRGELIMPIEIPIDKWPGSVREVVLGATEEDGGTRSKSIKVGGETTLPFLHFEAPMPNKPVIAIEIKDHKPGDWSPLLEKAWGSAMNDPGDWAVAAEKTGAEIIVLALSLNDENGEQTTPEKAVASVKKVLESTKLPLIVYGPGQVDLDNELMVPVAEASKGERIVLGICEDKNYRTIVATAMANGHLVTARTPMDVNLSKQLNILIIIYKV